MDNPFHAIQRDIGSLDERTKNLAGGMVRMEEKLDATNEKLDTLLQQSAHERGRRAGLVSAGSVAGSVVGFLISKIVDWAKH